MAECSIESVIIDVGSRYTKAGISSDDRPLAIFETVVGSKRHGVESDPNDILASSRYFGTEATSRSNQLKLKYPVEYGVVTNWDHWTDVLRYCFDKRLCCDMKEFPLGLVFQMGQPKVNLEKACQIAFEEFEVPAYFHVLQPTAEYLSSGSTSSSGIVVELGASHLQVIPIYNGLLLPFATPRAGMLAGMDPAYQFAKLTNQTTSAEFRSAMNILHQYGYVAKSPGETDATRTNAEAAQQYGSALHEAYEVLFKPALAGYEENSVGELIDSAIRKSDPSIRREISRNIWLCGAVAGIPGMIERVQSSITYKDHLVTVTAHPNPKIGAWLGTRDMACCQDLIAKTVISSAEYDEHGPSLVHSRFLY
jgi:actin-related protein